jgi:hypothetical protein
MDCQQADHKDNHGVCGVSVDGCFKLSLHEPHLKQEIIGTCGTNDKRRAILYITYAC